VREIRTLGSVRGEGHRRYGEPKRARSWKRRIQPRRYLQGPMVPRLLGRSTAPDFWPAKEPNRRHTDFQSVIDRWSFALRVPFIGPGWSSSTITSAETSKRTPSTSSTTTKFDICRWGMIDHEYARSPAGAITCSTSCAICQSSPPRPARLATNVANSSGVTGFGMCAW
jgi:hypothetical protein